jgi:hypothetical protein
MSMPDPLAAALRTVLNRRGKQYVNSDELGFARQLREVAQIAWMQAGEPRRLREEDGDRAAVCRELLRQKRRQSERYAEANSRRAAEKRRLRLVPPPE